MIDKLPEKIIKKKKWSFSANSYLHFKKCLRGVAGQILTREFVEKQDMFNYDYLRQIMDCPPHPRLRWHFNFLWTVIGIAIWENMFLKTNILQGKKVKLEEYYS